MERVGYALELAYRGARFRGFARQPGLRTIEQSLMDALAGAGLRPSLAVAGRTDAGVHARRQVVSFRIRERLDLVALRRALAERLPRDLRLLRLASVGASFHARASVVTRSYLYRLRVGGQPSSIRLVLPEGTYDWNAAAAFLGAQDGEQDRAAFTTRPEGPMRTALRATTLLFGAGGRLAIRFRGEGFTRHLVRNWVGTALALARGEREPPRGPRGYRGKPAAAHGLTLWDIEYAPDPFRSK